MSEIINYGAFAATLAPGKQVKKVLPASLGFKSPVARAVGNEGLTVEGGAKATSRRRRLWELPQKYHCPIIGVCFDVAELRRLIGKVLKYPADTTDYVWHTIAVGICDTRCPLSEQLNRLLDRRFSLTIRRMAACKTADDLRLSWREICRIGGEVPAGLWAICTHPACDDALEHEVHADIHMIQHQVGAGTRMDLQAMERLCAENRRLQQDLETMRKRQEQQRIDHAQAVQRLNQRIGVLQAGLSAREAACERLQGETERMRAMAPHLDERLQLQLRLRDAERRMLEAQEREAHLEKEVARLRDFSAFAEETIVALTQEATPGAGGLAAINSESLLGKSVLCVGGRSGSVTSYRSVVEQSGGRFMHHDGGREESLRRIEGALAAADIVICQVGCISHNAYWRVKEQCKRTGKPCMFVKNSGLSSFERVISEAGKQVEDSGVPEGDA